MHGIRDVPLSNFLKEKLKQNNNIDFLFLLPNGKFIQPRNNKQPFQEDMQRRWNKSNNNSYDKNERQ